MTQWRPWHIARAEYAKPDNIPEDLRIRPEDDVGRVPSHADLGAAADTFVRGRLTGEGLVPRPGRYGAERFERRYDTNGDGVADTYVSSHPKHRDEVQGISVGGPFGAEGTKLLAVDDGKVGRVVVRGDDGSKETFEPGQYQRVASDGRQVRLRDSDGDGVTDHVTIGRQSWTSRLGWPFVGYAREG